MKLLYQSTAALLLLLPISMTSLAAPEKPAMPPMPPMKGMGMMGGGMTEEQKAEFMRSRQEDMLAIHDLSNRILSEQDPAKKEALKNQQLDLMKAQHEKTMQGFKPAAK